MAKAHTSLRFVLTNLYRAAICIHKLSSDVDTAQSVFKLSYLTLYRIRSRSAVNASLHNAGIKADSVIYVIIKRFAQLLVFFYRELFKRCILLYAKCNECTGYLICRSERKSLLYKIVCTVCSIDKALCGGSTHIVFKYRHSRKHRSKCRDTQLYCVHCVKYCLLVLLHILVVCKRKSLHHCEKRSTSALDNATILKQCFSDSFGDDFIKLDVQTFVSSLTQEVRTPQLQSFVINGWSADFGDPVNFLGQEILHDDNAYYAHYYSNIARVAEAPADYQKDLMDAFEQYTDLVNAASAIVNDTDARYEAFAKAEAYMLENVLVSPTYYDVAWSLTHANEYSKINAMYGSCNYKAVNWETSEEAYTTVQYEQFAKAFDAATQG